MICTKIFYRKIFTFKDSAKSSGINRQAKKLKLLEISRPKTVEGVCWEVCEGRVGGVRGEGVAWKSCQAERISEELVNRKDKS